MQKIGDVISELLPRLQAAANRAKQTAGEQTTSGPDTTAAAPAKPVRKSRAVRP